MNRLTTLKTLTPLLALPIALLGACSDDASGSPDGGGGPDGGSGALVYCYDDNGDFQIDPTECSAEPRPDASSPGFVCIDDDDDGELDDCNDSDKIVCADSNMDGEDDYCCEVEDGGREIDDCAWIPGKVPPGPTPGPGDKVCYDGNNDGQPDYCCEVDDGGTAIEDCTPTGNGGTPPPPNLGGHHCFDNDNDGVNDYCCEIENGRLDDCRAMPPGTGGGGACKKIGEPCVGNHQCCSGDCEDDNGRCEVDD